MFVINLKVDSRIPSIFSGEFPEDKIDRLIGALQREVGEVEVKTDNKTQTEEGFSITDIYIDVNPKEQYKETNSTFLIYFLANYLTEGRGLTDMLRT